MMVNAAELYDPIVSKVIGRLTGTKMVKRAGRSNGFLSRNSNTSV